MFFIYEFELYIYLNRCWIFLLPTYLVSRVWLHISNSYIAYVAYIKFRSVQKYISHVFSFVFDSFMNLDDPKLSINHSIGGVDQIFLDFLRTYKMDIRYLLWFKQIYYDDELIDILLNLLKFFNMSNELKLSDMFN